MDPLALPAEDAEDLHRTAPSRAEPVRDLRVELGGLTRAHRHVVAAEQEPQLTGERAQVITAAGQGSAAAIAINNDLVQDDIAGALRASR